MGLLLLLLACGKEDGEAGEGFAWRGGEFAFTTLAAEDACLDGALEALFMPGGPDDPQEFEYPVYLPGYEELPLSYDVSLREPFVGMPLTVEDGGDGWLIGAGVMDAVALGQVAYGDCEVTMTARVEVLPTSADAAEGSASIDISDPRGEDGRCPVYEADPCRVTLTLEAERQ